MKLTELKKLVDDMSRRAKRAEVNPDVMLIVMPSFPAVSTLKTAMVSTLDNDIDEGSGKPTVFLCEDKEFGPLPGDIIEAIERRENES
jgi:hypothetical protein